MNHIETLVLSSLLAVVAGVSGTSASPAPVSAPAPEEVHFAARPGLSLAKTFYTSHELGLTAVNRSRNGGQPVTDGTRGWVSTWLKVSIEDRYDEVADGRPTRFERRYTDLGGGGKLSMKIGARATPQEELMVAVSPLRDRSVRYTWVSEEAGWSRAWEQFDAEEWWLAELAGDFDLLALLPAGPVAVGDSWNPPMDAVRRLLAPGGNHLITPRTKNIFGRTVEVGIGGDFSEVLGSDLAGSLEARFTGVREVDGRRLGVIEFTVKGLRSLQDRTDLWRTSMPIEEQRERSRLLACLLEYSLEGSGELLWDLEAGHMHAFELGGKETYDLVVSKEITGERAVFELSQHSVFEGEIAVKVTLDAAPPETVEPPRDGR